jgi:hypothetical protein
MDNTSAIVLSVKNFFTDINEEQCVKYVGRKKLPNSPKVKAAMNSAFKKMMKWPRWYLRFQIWRCRNDPFTKTLIESGAMDVIMKDRNRFAKGSGVYTCIVCGKKTRDTGLGEAQMDHCAYCFEVGGLDNELQDYRITAQQYYEHLAKLKAIYKRT